MQYCHRCLYPANHPLHLTFDELGVCSGCRIHEERDAIDWTARETELRAIFDSYRNRSGNSYDCIIPVSGARDSYFIVDLLKNRYGMTPLLVTYNRHHNTPRGIRNLAYLRTLTDGDHIQQIVQPGVVKRVMRETMRLMGSMYWHVLAGQTVLPVQIAVRLKVPLIVWGMHQGCDQVGMYSHLDNVEMTRKYRCDHDLMGYEAEDLIGRSEGLSEQDLRPYMYPHDKEIERTGVRGIYLSNYVRWDTKAQHEAMLAKYGYETALQQRTFDTYNDVDCLHYSGIHDYIKFCKWGYGRASDHATRELRLKRLSREQGIDLVRRYQDIVPDDLDDFLAFADMDRREFFECLDRVRDPAIWRKDAAGQWQLKDSVISHPEPANARVVALDASKECEFILTPTKSVAADAERYPLLQRGWVDGHPSNGKLHNGQPRARQ